MVTKQSDSGARKPRADGVATRAAILEAALDEFSEKGYALASTRAICARAGANPALVNRYFGSKDDLYRRVAQELFGELGAPLAKLPETVHDSASWQAAIRRWVDAFLYMTLPAEKAQCRCSALFRHEVTQPTAFHEEFRQNFGKPVFDSLRQLLAMAVKDEEQLDLWVSAVWSQVSVYALVNETWQTSFRPKGVEAVAWSSKVGDFVCATVFKALAYSGKVRVCQTK